MEPGKTTACFGEVMLRLGAPGKLRLAQSLPGMLEATFGGERPMSAPRLPCSGAKAAI